MLVQCWSDEGFWVLTIFADCLFATRQAKCIHCQLAAYRATQFDRYIILRERAVTVRMNHHGDKRCFLPDKLSLGESRRRHLAKGGRSLSCACLDFSSQVMALTKLTSRRYQRWGRQLIMSMSRTYSIVGESLITFRFTAPTSGRVLHAVVTWLDRHVTQCS